MTPSARIAAAIDVLDKILSGQPAEQALLRWSRGSRFAGSGDRAAVRDLVFDGLRRRNSLVAMGGSLSGRGIMIGHLRAAGQDPEAVFTGTAYAPSPLTDGERRVPAGRPVPDLPDWIMPAWSDSLGPDAEAVAEAMSLRAPVWLRVNTVKSEPGRAIRALAADGVTAEPDDRLSTALRVTGGERKLARSSAYLDGLVELQDLSPQLACAALPLAAGDRVLDYCAGGGGKVLALAARQPDLKAFAHDADPARMGDLPVRAARAGARITVVDAPAGMFDLVVADVPCSGSGTWRRTPDAKWRLQESTFTKTLNLQSQIMGDASGFVLPGGVMAYMTCSLLDAENRAQVAGFLSRRPNFVLIRDHTWTPLTASDGFYMALLRRER